MKIKNSAAASIMKQHVQTDKIKKVFQGGVSLAGRILIAVAEEAADWDFMVHHQSLSLTMGARQGRGYLEMIEREKEMRLERQELGRLIERKYIIQRREGERVVDALSIDGKIAALKVMIRLCESELPPGCECIVMFDIPEAARVARNEFRRFLKQARFEFCQGSVWVSRKDVGGLLKECIALLRIERWVQVRLTRLI